MVRSIFIFRGVTHFLLGLKMMGNPLFFSVMFEGGNSSKTKPQWNPRFFLQTFLFGHLFFDLFHPKKAESEAFFRSKKLPGSR